MLQSLGGEGFSVTVSELNQLASSWGVTHIIFTFAIIGNITLNNKLTLKGNKIQVLSCEQ